MNAQDEIARLLDESGAVLLRQSKHLVYRLANGKKFVMAKTPRDPERAAKNSLTDLRRALGIAREVPIVKGEPEMPYELPPAIVAAVPEPLREESLKNRIEAAIGKAEAAQEKLLAEAQTLERRVHMLKALLAFADDPAIEAALRAVLPTVETPPPTPQEVAEPPQQITERVQVTRQLVLAATRTFDRTFTVNDVMALMTGGKQIDGAERMRVRTSIAQAMMTLYGRGELIREVEGIGKRQAVWRKAVLTSRGAP